MAKFIKVLVEGGPYKQEQLINVDHIQRVKPNGTGGISCQIIFSNYKTTTPGPDSEDYINVGEPFDDIIKRIDKA